MDSNSRGSRRRARAGKSRAGSGNSRAGSGEGTVVIQLPIAAVAELENGGVVSEELREVQFKFVSLFLFI